MVPADKGGTLLLSFDRWVPVVCLALSLTCVSAVPVDSTTLRAYRFGSTYYVAVDQVAKYYGLGRNQRTADNCAQYKTSFAQLEVEAEHRDVLLNGVNHWLAAPILSTRSRLWISKLDVLKTIDPVLRPEHARTSGASVRTIVLDPGHGGSDRGTRGRSCLEKDMTLDVARRVEKLLIASGIRVCLTRTSDTTVPLEDRVEFARSKGADLYVSIHFNSGGSAAGIETYCTPPAGASSTANSFRSAYDDPDRSDLDAVPSNRVDIQNVWLAHCIQKSLLRATDADDRGVRRARFYVLRNATCPSVLVEAGFLSNAAEERRILRSDYRDTLAKAITDGIFGYKKTVDSR